MDTIFALTSAAGRAGVAVIRISGPDAYNCAEQMVSSMPKARIAGLRNIFDPVTHATLDQGLVLCFDHGASFTGENLVEFQIHGSPATITAVLKSIGKIAETRLAEPGEFTQRALKNGCLDLTQVEGLSDLLAAETEAQRKQALRVMSGALSDIVASWRQKLLRVAALQTAMIDFSDEDVPENLSHEIENLIRVVQNDIDKQLRGASAAQQVRMGQEVAIIGRPNSGKSTLLNALAQREAAITSDIAGTTRDVIEVRMDIGGLEVTVLDTAGIRKSDDPLEIIGIKRAIERASTSDLRVYLLEENQMAPDKEVHLVQEDIIIRGKSDLSDGDGLSGLTGAGVDELLVRIKNLLEAQVSDASLIVRQRHVECLTQASAALVAVDFNDLVEIQSENIRRAIHAIDFMVGKIDVEDILGEIFANFCIGK